MRQIIFYKLNGVIEYKEELNYFNLKHINGMKSKCYLKNGEIKIGFADLYSAHNYDVEESEENINLWIFDNLNEFTHQLIGVGDERYSKTFEKVLIDDIVTIEAILYSNPRWGTKLTNNFSFEKNKNTNYHKAKNSYSKNNIYW